MKYYEIEYETDSGVASFDGDYESEGEFLKDANAFAHESGALPLDENIIEDCEWEMTEITKLPSQENYLDVH